MLDYFSRYCEIGALQKSTFQEVINRLKSIFARQGIPETVISDQSDNGPQYSSAEFAKFAGDWGFTPITSSPKYPQSTREAERMVQTTKTSLQNPTIHMKHPSLTEQPHLKTDLAQPNYAQEGDYAPPYQLPHQN